MGVILSAASACLLRRLCVARTRSRRAAIAPTDFAGDKGPCVLCASSVNQPLHCSNPVLRCIVSPKQTEGDIMGLNWPAIVVAGLADWLLGAVWFTVFASQWRAGLRMTPEELQAYMAHPDFWPYIISAICSIILAYVIARLLGSSSGHSVFRGISIGMLVGLAAAVAMVTEMIFEYRARPF